MWERETPRVQRLTTELGLHRLHSRVTLPRSAIQRITEQRVSHLREVDADLVRAASLESDLQECGSMESLPRAPGGDRGLPRLRSPGEALPIARMPGVECLEAARVARVAVHECEVRLLDRALLESTLECVKSGVILGDDEASGRLLVEPMDDPGAEHTTDAGKARDVVEERVHERSSCVTRCRMDDEACRLVEDEEVTVLVQHCEWEILGLGYGRLGRRDRDLERLASLEAERRAPGPPIDEDASGLEQRLDSRPAELGKAGGDGTVESVTPERRTDGEPMNRRALSVAL